MSPVAPESIGHGDESVPAWAVRLEAKLDVALAQHSAQIDRNTQKIEDAVARIKRIEDEPRFDPLTVADHETRLRTVEARPVLTTKGVMAAIGAVGALVSILVVFVTFLDRLYT